MVNFMGWYGKLPSGNLLQFAIENGLQLVRWFTH